MSDLIAQLDLPELYQQSIQARWLDQVLWMEKKADECRRWHYRLRLTTIIGGVILPALVGINFQMQQNPTFRQWFPYMTFTLSQVIAVSAAVEEFCRFGDRWRQYRQTVENLKTEGWQYLQSSGLYEKHKNHQEGYAQFATRVESIIKDDVQSYITELVKQKAQEEEQVQKSVEAASHAAKQVRFEAPPPAARPAPASGYSAHSSGAAVPQPASSGYASGSVSPQPASSGYASAPPGYSPAPAYANAANANAVPAPVGNGSGWNGSGWNGSGWNGSGATPPPPLHHSPQALMSPPSYASPAAPSAYPPPTQVPLAAFAPPASPVPPAKGSSGTLHILQDTVFKLSPQAAEYLPDSQKILVKGGSAYPLHSFVEAENQHLRVALEAIGLGAENRNTWYVFAGHVAIEGMEAPAAPRSNGMPQNGMPQKNGSSSGGLQKLIALTQGQSGSNGKIQLPVPFFKQIDNKEQAERTCNTSSCAMVAKYLGAKISGDDEYFQYVIHHGDTTDHSAQTRALQQIGIQSTWNTTLDFEDLDKSLAANLPIVIGILHRGSDDAPTGGGHMIVVIGRTADGDYICNDPYGSMLNGYTSPDAEDGNAVIYPRHVLVRRWTCEGPKSGWGRLFYGNTVPQ